MSVLEQEIVAEQALAEALSEYAGHWVAVSHHEVVAHAATLKELREQIGPAKVTDVEGVFQVPEGDPAACFF